MSKDKTAKKRKIGHSGLSVKLLMQYFLSIIGYIVFLFLFIVISVMICNSFIWYNGDPLYMFLHYIKENIFLFAGLVFVVGWFFITYHFISKSLRYLDEAAEAAKHLVSTTEEPISLSSDMFFIENELNAVREQALNNARAAKAAEQRKNDLVVYLAHDLKTPLTSVIGYLTLLHDEKHISDELRDKYVSISLEKAERLEDLINEFFEITRFNLSEITLQYSRVNITRLLEQLTFEFQPMFLEKSLTYILDIPPDIYLMCDADKMQRVFDNLLRNAVNYSFEKSTIYISATLQKNNIHIKFTNEGNTISKENLNRIFDQFYRLDSSRSSKSGSAGLGLAIAKEIVEHHHGTITATSENGIIEFEVSLPLL